MNDPILDRAYLRYCPNCGSGGLTHPIVDKLACRDCGFELYFNAATAVIALIVDDRKRLLVTTRAREPAKGALGLPGGFVDLGESAEQALAREIREEVGLDLVQATYLCSEPNTYPYKGVVYKTVDLAFVCRVKNADGASPADDVATVRWCLPAEIDPGQFCFESMRRVFAAFASGSHS
jgi:NAD+ diphosphatase